MTIKVSILNNCIQSRIKCYYHAAQLIIEYSDTPNSSNVTAIYLLNKSRKETLNSSKLTLESINEYLANVIAIIHSHQLENNIPSTLENAKLALSQAEHIYNWMFRPVGELKPLIILCDSINPPNYKFKKGFLQVLENTPMRWLTSELTKEWLTILNPESKQPVWFKSLPAWQKTIFSDCVQIWNDRRKYIDIKYRPYAFTRLPNNLQHHFKMLIDIANKNENIENLNLGLFLGLQPGSETPYPGIKNGYRTIISNYVYNSQTKISIFKKSTSIRVGIPVTFNNHSKEEERLTIMNIKQAILYDIVYQYRVGLITSGMKRKIVIPVLIQTLESRNRHLNDDEVMTTFTKVFKKLKKQLKSPKYCFDFLNSNSPLLYETIKKNNVIKNPEQFLKVILLKNAITFDLIHTHHDFVSESSEVRRMNTTIDETSNFLKKYIAKSMLNSIEIDGEIIANNEQIPKSISANLKNNRPLAALSEIDSLPENIPVKYTIASMKMGIDALQQFINSHSLLNKVYRKFTNLVAIEAAAYLQIAFTSFGIRIGGCPNGCDIESPLTLILNSLRIFYNSNGYFPSHVQLIKSKQYIKDRKYLNKKIAEQFISGYCQDILDRASQGCFGVSYLDKTLGNGVFKELEHLIKLYSIDVDLESIYEDNHKISLLENINITNQLTDYEHTIEAAIKKYKSTNKSSCFAAVFIKDKKPTSLAHTFKHDDAMLLKQLESKFGLRTFEELHRCFEKEKHSTPSLSSSAKRLSRFASRFKKGNIINTRVSDIENDKKVLTHDDKINAFIAQAEIKSNAKINQYEK